MSQPPISGEGFGTPYLGTEYQSPWCLRSQPPISGEGFGTGSWKDNFKLPEVGVSTPYQRGRFWNC